MRNNITIVDYDTSNIKSVGNMLRKIGVKITITSLPEEVRQAEKIILPGIGSFDVAVKNLKKTGLMEALNEVVCERGVPILGICLGMQLFANNSDEGKLDGFGWIPGYVRHFDFASSTRSYPIPHMGWNYITPVVKGHPLIRNIQQPMRFYFVHSYHYVCESENDIFALTDYGYNFTSVVAKDNIFGVQFHPEKSHKFGMSLLRNFVESV